MPNLLLYKLANRHHRHQFTSKSSIIHVYGSKDNDRRILGHESSSKKGVDKNQPQIEAC